MSILLPSPRVDIAVCDFSDDRVLRQVHALQVAAYTVEARLIGCWSIPALSESPVDLARSREVFWGCFDASGSDGLRRCLGIVATEPEPGASGTTRISRLAVDPGCFRRGVGRRLVERVVDVHGATGGLIVSTGAANGPARRLYESAGFVLRREFRAPDDSVDLVEYVRMPGAR